ncbi:putative trihelix transcription factor ASIL1 [Iris pallida]|uniref:Trihelix transcription factor ASIL1 n=1 Tax=Iris pallida TaxID=29817 RepID=A0AAX6HE18_IRIPA|nr:putative trihelix transcription factor ASIL1 [Iris pallida]KAJ6840554.1 putative trihelix transcription factor ASIL1 [Iris pallida]
MSPSPPSSPSPSPSPSPAGVVSIAAASPSDLLPLALPAPNAPLPATTPSTRRIPPPCWTNDETLALIDSYKEKWLSLNRGNLRAAHWDDVADSVSLRSRSTPGATPKTSVQCRHKIEKLRKRYRSERNRSLSHDPRGPPSSPWIFFPHIHSMEQPPQPPPPQPHHRCDTDDDEDDDDEDQFLLRRPPVANGGLKFKVPKAVRSRGIWGSAPNPNPNPSPNPNPRDSPMTEVVRALRALGEGYVRTEQMKMEMAREMERTRMEAELRRTEMVLEAQRRIVDAVVGEMVAGKRKRKKAKIAASAAASAAAADS